MTGGTIGVSLEYAGRSKPIPCTDEPELKIDSFPAIIFPESWAVGFLWAPV